MPLASTGSPVLHQFVLARSFSHLKFSTLTGATHQQSTMDRHAALAEFQRVLAAAEAHADLAAESFRPGESAMSRACMHFAAKTRPFGTVVVEIAQHTCATGLLQVSSHMRLHRRSSWVY